MPPHPRCIPDIFVFGGIVRKRPCPLILDVLPRAVDKEVIVARGVDRCVNTRQTGQGRVAWAHEGNRTRRADRHAALHVDAQGGRELMTSIPEDNLEHERRFIVSDSGVLDGTTFQWIDQGYLWAAAGFAIRVRLTDQTSDPDAPSNSPAMLTLKGPRHDAVRFEQEMPIPLAVAQELLALSNFRITKKRHAVISATEVWVVDVFEGANAGLVIAEFEGSSDAVAALKIPYWCGDEVTDDRRYDNENLARHPLTTWTDK